MSDSRLSDLQEADSVVTQLRAELRKLIEAKWDAQRRDFRSHKKLVAKLLKELSHDVRAMRFK